MDWLDSLYLDCDKLTNSQKQSRFRTLNKLSLDFYQEITGIPTPWLRKIMLAKVKEVMKSEVQKKRIPEIEEVPPI